MPTILVTNDDGVHAPGLLALKQALSAIAEVLVLAPERNWSASGHSKTMHKPLRVHEVTLADGTPAFSSSGGPTDCVALAAEGVLGKRPDLVVSGINNGYNMGSDITYSGTVACALEATIYGIPGIAISTAAAKRSPIDVALLHPMAGRYARLVVERVLAEGLPPDTLLNVNVPAVAPSELKGIEITRQGKRRYKDELIKREDPYGQPYYWLGGLGVIDFPDDGTDVGAIANGFVSVTPIGLDYTKHSFLSTLAEWHLQPEHPSQERDEESHV
ncbi:MAG: 5'/3'-nucleotidase SurE [Caldilineaceae bacterium]|nr:5'/3'-nucleotidase SurE [Caldilineaceae bacterium]